jgi:hypothetical protein
MNQDCFVTTNYKISKPNHFQYVDIIKCDKKYKISMDCYDVYELLKKENLNKTDIEKLNNFLFDNSHKVKMKYN